MRLLQDDRVSAGNYHRAAPIETFTASANQRHPTDPDEKVTLVAKVATGRAIVDAELVPLGRGRNTEVPIEFGPRQGLERQILSNFSPANGDRPKVAFRI
jgi:hypothetical protein